MIIFRKNIVAQYVPDTNFISIPNSIYPHFPNFHELDYINGTAVLTIMKSCIKTYPQRRIFRKGHIALAPNNAITNRLQAQLKKFAPGQIVFKYYNSLEDIVQYQTSKDYREDICLGIALEQSSGSYYKYYLMFNQTNDLGDYTEVPSEESDAYNNLKHEMIQKYYVPWLKFGFVTIQQFLDNIIFNEEKSYSGNVVSIKARSCSQKVEGHINDQMADILVGNFGQLIVFPLIIIYLRMTYGLLVEKEKKIREGMRIMGMKDLSFYISWVLYYLIKYTIISLVVALILAKQVFVNSNFLVIFLWHWLFCWSLIFQSIFISTFFTRAKLGNIVAMVFFLLMFICVFLVNNNTVSEKNKTLFSLSSQMAISFGGDLFTIVESEQKGIGFNNLYLKVENYRMITCLLMELANILIFLILGFYFEQVIPNEWGMQKSPLFCLKSYFKQFRYKVTPELQNPNSQNEDIDLEQKNICQDKFQRIEPVDKFVQDLELKNQIIDIVNLRKQYSNGKVAVHQLNLKMYSGQIFVLLGHNGAGKTTTLSMLTGMIDITSGNVFCYGLNLRDNLEEIRQYIGLCPQHDILFPDLTVKEHLELFAVFKGVKTSEISSAVKQAIKDVDLESKTNDLAGTLSGGQRRRLSVAIAFIGSSKLIYLDEPTSGMDTSARRYIWEMLKKYKQNRIIVLTTHFMDEADYLGDRIGIMGDGKLICCGSSVFLKNSFGVGYNITFVKQNPQAESINIIKVVKSFIPKARILSDVSTELEIQLPLGYINQFEPLFEEIDKNVKNLQIASYGVSITTMEEVFLRVAKYGEIIIQHRESLIMDLRSKSNFINSQANIEADNFCLKDVKIKNISQLRKIHLWNLMKKRVLYFKRDIRGLTCEIFLPCLIILLGLCLMLINFMINPKPRFLNASIYGIQLPTLYGGTADQTDMDTIASKFTQSSFSMQQSSATTLSDFDEENFSLRSKDRKGAYWFDSIDFVGDTYEYITEVATRNRDIYPILLNSANNAIIRASTNNDNFKIDLWLKPFEKTVQQKKVASIGDGMIGAFIFSMGLAFIPAGVITFIVKEKEDQVKHQQVVCGVSITAYWFSNLIVDYLKYMIPAIFGIVMVKAFNIDAFQKDYCYSAISLLFLLYGWCQLCFSYALSFFFKSHSNAQVSAFFINFISGSIFPVVVFVLRIIQTTKKVGIILQWIFRIIPSFSFGYGVMNIGCREIYKLRYGQSTAEGPYSMDIAGGDIIYLLIFGFVYLAFVFLFEYLKVLQSVNKLFSKEQKIPYVPKKYDDDVEKEINKVQQAEPSHYNILVNKLRKVYVTPYHNITAVDQISFAVENGECFALLGVNGAGKTTTFKMLTGEISPTSGSAFIMGHNILTDMRNASSYIGYCPQFDALLEFLTAKEHLELFAAIKGIPSQLRKKLVQQKLIEMDLKKYENVCAGTYSGGNKRKLQVAIAMIGNPPIVFLDEPSTGMDPEARRFMWDVIFRLSTQRKQSSIILTTHSMEEAEALSTRLAIQVNGTFRCLGPVQHIKNKFGQGYEIEIKIQNPTHQDVVEFVANKDINLSNMITKNQLQNLLSELKCESLLDIIQDEEMNYSIVQQLNGDGIECEQLIYYIIIEKHGQEILKFIQQQFDKYNLIEHFQTFYRYKIQSQISIGKVFGIFEQNKTKLFISYYSVKQATIEQIFNMFAEGLYDKMMQKCQSQNNIDQQQQNDKKVEPECQTIEIKASQSQDETKKQDQAQISNDTQ